MCSLIWYFLASTFYGQYLLYIKLQDLDWVFGLLQEKLVASNYYLNKSAKDAYRTYLLAYNSHSMKDIFDVHRLDLQVKAFLLGKWQLLSFLISLQSCSVNIWVRIVDNNFRGDGSVLEI